MGEAPMPRECPQLLAKPDAKLVAVSDGMFLITLRPFQTAVLTKQ
jgi:hypothetical protein